MTHQDPDEESLLALKTLEDVPGGLSLRGLHDALSGGISRRTLSRRLNVLMASGAIRRAGKGPSARYEATRQSIRVVPDAAQIFRTAEGLIQLPLSRQSSEILAYVQQAPGARTPRGYSAELLQSYRPNQDNYLDEDTRVRLRRIGQPIVAERAAGTFARDILGRFLIDLSWASSRLEGNTYSRLDTERLLEFGQEAEGKDAKETQMILNHKGAIELLTGEDSPDIGLNRYTLLNLHSLLSDNLMVDPEASGRLRKRPVDIAGSVFTPLAIPQLIEQHFDEILRKAAAITDPFEQAFFVMVHVPYLQPFEDVNKRVSRLSANIPLIRADLCPLSFVDVPERAYVAATLGVYELQRVDLLADLFVWAYERSCQRYVVVRDSIAEPDRFRMRHRQALTEVIAQVVRKRQAATEGRVRALARPLLEPRDIDRFVVMAVNELKRLKEGNIARYRLKLSEYRAWREAASPRK